MSVVIIFIIRKTVHRQPEQDPHAAGIHFDLQHVDFGVIHPSEVLERDLKLTNETTNTIYVVAVEASCSCTVPTESLAGKPVSAGSAIVIPIQFTTPIHSGPTSSTIRVKAREANGKTFYTEVTLGGNIAADYSFDPAYLDFGRTLKTDSPTRSVHIYHQTQGIELIAITNVPSWASARISKSASNITEIGFTILPERMSQSGMHEAQVKLSFNSRWVPSVTLPIRCQVAAPIEIIPSRIVLSDAEPERRDDARFSIVSVEPTRVIGARIKLLNGKTFAPKWNTDSACTTNHKVVVEQSMISEANRIEFEIATLGTGTAKEEAKQVSVEVKRLRKAIRNEETQNSNK